MNFSFKEIISVTIILFSVIDILGSIPVIIDLRKKAGDIHAEQATLVAGSLMIVYLFLGVGILNLFGVDVKSFAVAGAIIIFLIGMEMILGRNFYSTPGFSDYCRSGYYDHNYFSKSRLSARKYHCWYFIESVDCVFSVKKFGVD
jgi:hypothetical protein